MARRFAKVLGDEIEEAFFYPSDLVNTKTTIPFRVGEERWIYIPRPFRVSVCIHHYSPPLWGIVVYYFTNLVPRVYSAFKMAAERQTLAHTVMIPTLIGLKI